MEIAGTQTKEDAVTNFDEIHGNKSQGHGYVVGTMANGDNMYVRIQGSSTLKDGAVESANGAWSFTGGTGKLKGVKGKAPTKAKVRLTARLPMKSRANTSFRSSFHPAARDSSALNGEPRRLAVLNLSQTHAEFESSVDTLASASCRVTSPPPHWIELAADEKTLFALEPTNRIVPTTRTRITANITAYSAMSWPSSSRHMFQNILNMFHLLPAKYT